MIHGISLPSLNTANEFVIANQGAGEVSGSACLKLIIIKLRLLPLTRTAMTTVASLMAKEVFSWHRLL